MYEQHTLDKITARLLRDEPAAFDELVLLVQTELRTYIAARGASWELADEVLQKTFVRAYEHLNRFDPRRSNIDFWLRGIARNCLREEWRRSQRYKTASLDRIEAIINQRRLDLNDANDDIPAERLTVCLKKLNPKSRELLRRRYTDNISLKVLAQHYSKPANSIAGRLHRLRLTLKKCMQAVP